jgi:hypothetical protein
MAKYLGVPQLYPEDYELFLSQYSAIALCTFQSVPTIWHLCIAQMIYEKSQWQDLDNLAKHL